MNDVRRMIYGSLVLFFLMLAFWFSIIYVSSCGFTLSCNQADQIVVRTPVPTLIPRMNANPQPGGEVTEFDQCRVAATDLIAAWAIAGHTENEPFAFTDLDGQDCAATFEDIQPLFVENSFWSPGALGCTSCHNAELTERSSGLDLSSYDAIALGARRVQGSTSPGTDIFGRGEWENSLLHEYLVNQGLIAQGHSPDAPPPQVIIYAGERLTEPLAAATNAPTATLRATATVEAPSATVTPTP
jgi:hypothetical protein